MRRKPSHMPTGRLPSLRLFSTLLAVTLKIPGPVGVLSKTMVMMSAQLQRHSNVERPSPVPDETAQAQRN